MAKQIAHIDSCEVKYSVVGSDENILHVQNIFWGPSLPWQNMQNIFWGTYHPNISHPKTINTYYVIHIGSWIFFFNVPLHLSRMVCVMWKFLVTELFGRYMWDTKGKLFAWVAFRLFVWAFKEDIITIFWIAHWFWRFCCCTSVATSFKF